MHDNTTERPDNGMRALLGEDAFEQLYSPQTQMALALGRVKHTSQIYAGTVPAATVAKRRVRNKVARASRRANRLAARRQAAHRA
jgi:hypothetical protein